MKRVAGIGLQLVQRHQNVEASLWRKFHIEGQKNCRDRLIAFYQDLADKVARGEFQKRPRYGLEFDDFRQLAISGLIDSICRFDPLRGIPFEAFARWRIRGAISNGISQSSESAAHYTYQRTQAKERVASLLEQANQASLSNLDKLNEVVIGLAIGMILESSVLNSLVALDPDPYEYLAFNDVTKSVLACLSTLPDPGGSILRDHYLKGTPFTTIAENLGLSKGRISQIHKDALKGLKDKMRQLNWSEI